MEDTSGLETSNSGLTETSGTMGSSGNVKIAELTHDQFCVLFKQLFSEAMDESMEKMNCKFDELKQELNVKMSEVKSECEGKMGKMEMELNERVYKLKGELHDVQVENEELVKTNAGLKEELQRLNNECVNNFRGILKIKQETKIT